MEPQHPKPLVSFILGFTTLVFLVGVAAFGFTHSVNKSLKDALEIDGMTGIGHVISIDANETRKLNQSSMRWQYMTDHQLVFWYNHTGGIAASQSGKQFKGGHGAKKNLGRIEVTTPISKETFKKLKYKKTFDIVYLNGQPNSVKLLNPEGTVDIPALSIFIYLCGFLSLCSAGMFVHHLRTGKTF